MWKLIKLCVVVGVLLSVSCGSGTREVKSESGNFSVMSPVSLEESTSTQDIQIASLTNHVFKGTTGKVYYFVIYQETTPPVIKESDLDEAMEAEITSAGGTKSSSKPYSFGNAPGREFTFTGVKRPYEAKARLFLVGERLYHLAVRSDGQPLPADADAFLDSFKLLK